MYKIELTSRSIESGITDYLLKSLYKTNEKILLLCQREESFAFLDEVVALRSRVPNELLKFGEYRVIDSRDERRFKAMAYIEFSEDSINAIKLAYRYFYSITICQPLLSWNNLLNDSSLFMPDLLFEGAILNKKLNYCLIKGLSPNEIFLSFDSDMDNYLSLKDTLEVEWDISTI
jgi:hypothetical protein